MRHVRRVSITGGSIGILHEDEDREVSQSDSDSYTDSDEEYDSSEDYDKVDGYKSALVD